jgi:hypothetical protein
MFIPNRNDVVAPNLGSVERYLMKVDDKLSKRSKVRLHLSDLTRPVKQGGLGWSVSNILYGVRDGDTSYDWKATGLEVGFDNQALADRLESEARERGYVMVFFVERNTIYAARNYE